MADAHHKMHKQIEAARLVREHLKDVLGEETDADIIRDSIEGETALTETIEAVAQQVAIDQASIAALDQVAAKLKDRIDRKKKRVESLKAIVKTAMETAEIKVHEGIARITLKSTNPILVVDDEAEIPSQFFTTPVVEPKLDRKGLTDTLRERAKAVSEAAKIKDDTERAAAMKKVNAEYPAIPGAALSEPGTTTQWRFG